MEIMVFWRSSSEMSRPWRWLMRRILKRSVESWSGVASQGAGLHNAVRSEPSPQPTSNTWYQPYCVTDRRKFMRDPGSQIMIVIRKKRRGILRKKVSYNFDIFSPQDVQRPHLSLLEEGREECNGHYGRMSLRRWSDRKTAGVSREELIEVILLGKQVSDYHGG